jgi:ApaG protein
VSGRAWGKEVEAHTEGVRVAVQSIHIPERSFPEEDRYFFAYSIVIENHSEIPVRLTHRHWIITDARGQVERVDGPGVVGETPRMEPGQGFQYTSFCPLSTAFGTMEGTYDMRRDDGSVLEVAVPQFVLATPTAVQ